MSTAASAPKQQLKLKLKPSPGSEPNTPSARDSATPGVIVDNDALLRQQRHVLNSMGNRSSRAPSGEAGTPGASANPFVGSKSGASTTAPLSASQSRTAGSPPVANGVKQDVQSPALSAIRPASTAPDSSRLSVPVQTPHPNMAPPQNMSRPGSGSPHPNGLGLQNGHYPPQQQQVYQAPPVPRVDCFRKVPLKSTHNLFTCLIFTLTTMQAMKRH